jgi:hypothetical protein
VLFRSVQHSSTPSSTCTLMQFACRGLVAMCMPPTQVSEAQQQWWSVKATNFDSVLLFKVGKFYEVSVLSLCGRDPCLCVWSCRGCADSRRPTTTTPQPPNQPISTSHAGGLPSSSPPSSDV